MGASSLVIASNRLPVTVELDDDGEARVSPSAGGLVSALRGLSEAHVWVGWPGSAVPESAESVVTALLHDEGNLPVFLTEAEAEGYYARMCNETIWPLFHYFIGGLRFTDDAWSSYVTVNERFADTIAGIADRGATVWVHDFHLALLPAALRSRRPDLAIGFFLHVPFPSSEIYRLLPTRRELLRGMLGADYVGFHTGDYVRHFRSACLRILGMESGPQQIDFDGRVVGLGALPIGIDVESFRATLGSPETAEIQAEMEERYRDGRSSAASSGSTTPRGSPRRSTRSSGSSTSSRSGPRRRRWSRCSFRRASRAPNTPPSATRSSSGSLT